MKKRGERKESGEHGILSGYDISLLYFSQLGWSRHVVVCGCGQIPEVPSPHCTPTTFACYTVAATIKEPSRTKQSSNTISAFCLTRSHSPSLDEALHTTATTSFSAHTRQYAAPLPNPPPCSLPLLSSMTYMPRPLHEFGMQTTPCHALPLHAKEIWTLQMDASPTAPRMAHQQGLGRNDGTLAVCGRGGTVVCVVLEGLHVKMLEYLCSRHRGMLRPALLIRVQSSAGEGRAHTQVMYSRRSYTCA